MRIYTMIKIHEYLKEDAQEKLERKVATEGMLLDFESEHGIQYRDRLRVENVTEEIRPEYEMRLAAFKRAFEDAEYAAAALADFEDAEWVQK